MRRPGYWPTIPRRIAVVVLALPTLIYAMVLGAWENVCEACEELAEVWRERVKR